MEFDTGERHFDEMDGKVGSGAQIAWNTGHAEIALPIEFKQVRKIMGDSWYRRCY